MNPLVCQEPWPWQSRQGFPWPGVQYFRAPEPFRTHGGARIEPWGLAYEEWGVTQGEPVVIFHALTGDSHVTSTALGGPGGCGNGWLARGAASTPSGFECWDLTCWAVPWDRPGPPRLMLAVNRGGVAFLS